MGLQMYIRWVHSWAKTRSLCASDHQPKQNIKQRRANNFRPVCILIRFLNLTTIYLGGGGNVGQSMSKARPAGQTNPPSR